MEGQLATPKSLADDRLGRKNSESRSGLDCRGVVRADMGAVLKRRLDLRRVSERAREKIRFIANPSAKSRTLKATPPYCRAHFRIDSEGLLCCTLI